MSRARRVYYQLTHALSCVTPLENRSALRLRMKRHGFFFTFDITKKAVFSHLFQMVLALRKGRFVIKHRTKMENDILLDIYKERN